MLACMLLKSFLWSGTGSIKNPEVVNKEFLQVYNILQISAARIPNMLKHLCVKIIEKCKLPRWYIDPSKSVNIFISM